MMRTKNRLPLLVLWLSLVVLLSRWTPITRANANGFHQTKAVVRRKPLTSNVVTIVLTPKMRHPNYESDKKIEFEIKKTGPHLKKVKYIYKIYLSADLQHSIAIVAGITSGRVSTFASYPGLPNGNYIIDLYPQDNPSDDQYSAFSVGNSAIKSSHFYPPSLIGNILSGGTPVYMPIVDAAVDPPTGISASSGGVRDHNGETGPNKNGGEGMYLHVSTKGKVQNETPDDKYVFIKLFNRHGRPGQFNYDDNDSVGQSVKKAVIGSSLPTDKNFAVLPYKIDHIIPQGGDTPNGPEIYATVTLKKGDTPLKTGDYGLLVVRHIGIEFFKDDVIYANFHVN